jgi:hypothetical protein
MCAPRVRGRPKQFPIWCLSVAAQYPWQWATFSCRDPPDSHNEDCRIVNIHALFDTSVDKQEIKNEGFRLSYAVARSMSAS